MADGPSLSGGSNAEILYREMHDADLRTILSIEQEAYKFPWTEAIFRDCLRVGYRCRVLERDAAIVAYGIASVAAGESHILNLCVPPSLRRQGLGKQMLNHLIEEVKTLQVDTVLLEVRESNAIAVALYESEGFLEIGRRKNYYPAADGKEDALMMARVIIF